MPGVAVVVRAHDTNQGAVARVSVGNVRTCPIGGDVRTVCPRRIDDLACAMGEVRRCICIRASKGCDAQLLDVGDGIEEHDERCNVKGSGRGEIDVGVVASATTTLDIRIDRTLEGGGRCPRSSPDQRPKVIERRTSVQGADDCRSVSADRDRWFGTSSRKQEWCIGEVKRATTDGLSWHGCSATNPKEHAADGDNADHQKALHHRSLLQPQNGLRP